MYAAYMPIDAEPAPRLEVDGKSAQPVSGGQGARTAAAFVDYACQRLRAALSRTRTVAGES